MGVFAGALIKKRRYWPALVPGNAIDRKFEALDVGDATSVKGSYEGVPYNIWCMKDVGYVTKIMGTGMGLGYPVERMHSRQLDDGTTRRFKYPEPFYLHFKYRHLIDDHNNIHHAVPSIKGTLKTQCWAIPVFKLVLSVAEVNMYLTIQHFVCSSEENVQQMFEFIRRMGFN